jgi:hypothetical protein
MTDLNSKVGEALLANQNNFMDEQKNPWWVSSQDPLKLSLTIRGALLMYVPFVLALAASLKVPLAESVVVEYVTTGSFLLAAFMLIAGIGRKVYLRFKK